MRPCGTPRSRVFLSREPGPTRTRRAARARRRPGCGASIRPRLRPSSATTSGRATPAFRRTPSRPSCSRATAISGSAPRRASSGSTAYASRSYDTRNTPAHARRLGSGPAAESRRHALDRHRDRAGAAARRRVPPGDRRRAGPRDRDIPFREPRRIGLDRLEPRRLASPGGPGSDLRRGGRPSGGPNPLDRRGYGRRPVGREAPGAPRGSRTIDSSHGPCATGSPAAPWPCSPIRKAGSGSARDAASPTSRGRTVVRYGEAEGLTNNFVRVLLRRPRRQPVARDRGRALPLPGRPVRAPRTNPTVSLPTGSFRSWKTVRAVSGSEPPTAASPDQGAAHRPVHRGRRPFGREAVDGFRGQPRQPLGRNGRGGPQPHAARKRSLRARRLARRVDHGDRRGRRPAASGSERVAAESSTCAEAGSHRYTLAEGLVGQLDLVGARRSAGAPSGSARWAPGLNRIENGVITSLRGPGRARRRRRLLDLRRPRREHLDRHVRRRRHPLRRRPIPDVHDEGRPRPRRRDVDVPGRGGHLLVRDARGAVPLPRRPLHDLPAERGRLPRRRAAGRSRTAAATSG